MMKFQTMEEFAKQAVDLALDEFEYEGKTIRAWTELILNGNLTEVVRCKDCKHRGTDYCIFHIKGEPADEELLRKLDDDFCSYGERR
jgi:hypothetical protein